MTESPTNSDSGPTAGSVKQTQKQKQKDVGTKPTTTKTAAAGVSKPRSRSGCHTCKAKHLKCDETKPECLVCIRKGWSCGGYQREFRWSYKHERKTKAGGRRKAKTKAGEDETQEQGRQRTKAPASSISVSEYPLEGLTLDFRADAHLPDFSHTLPPLPIIDYGWDSSEPDIIPQTEIITPIHNAGPWSPERSSANLIVPMLEQPEVPEAEYVEDDVEILPDAETHLALTTTIQHFEYCTQIPTPITHLPSVLITQWFKSVCSVWSAYDSDMNLNRQLATSLWSESESVSACLQSMSASFLATRIPYLRDTSLSMMKNATKSIHNELVLARNYKFVNSIPTGLLFSLFCLGTTLCWIEAGQLGIPFLRAAKSLLDQINQQRPILSHADGELLDFFNKSWVYCDMLLSVVSYDYAQFPMDEEPAQTPGSPPGVASKRTDDIPHPWTGISTAASTLFTRAIRLCRSFRHNVRKQAPTPSDIEMVLKQMEEAPRIEEQLLQLEYDTVVPMSETGDQHTPCVHLVKVAEAYRIAALLQLYQTFPDLVALRIPHESSSSRPGPVPWDEWIVPLSLRLIDILEHIPAESGSRMVQPLLCITASTGLRLDVPADAWRSGSLQAQAPVNDIPLGVHQESCDITEFMNQLDSVDQPTGGSNLPTQMSIDVGNARAFVLKRLNMLENTLPPKPIIMAKSLVQAIWAAYDSEMPGCNSVHWVDVMEEQNLRSFFG
ncbi:fungal-specific transcription factor domain-containing protein [Thelonectria olida]|uniref:Fungal-specific transcription factor domain-containing protein n=1 Tax=Thelonectria olida TaxID=1576542 RepID=A0A9P8WKP6_9HYPO|nr:fungal-specific transcription factor domain-containing protein [Thelonectria olida]